jgi:hypothetical protein
LLLCLLQTAHYMQRAQKGLKMSHCQQYRLMMTTAAQALAWQQQQQYLQPWRARGPQQQAKSSEQ